MPPRSRKLKDFRLLNTQHPGVTWKTGSERDASDKATAERPWADGRPFSCAACGKICLYSYYVLRPGTACGVSVGVLDRCAWCLSCFANGRYPKNLSDRHFVKMDVPAMNLMGDEEWTVDEHCRLMAGIEKYQENWEKISKHVKGKTPQQCVAYFISLPIDEASSRESRTSGSDLPFAEASNPLITQLAFLASVLNPGVAATAAHTAFKSLVKSIGKENSNQMSDQSFDDEAIETACREALVASSHRARQLARAEEAEIAQMMPRLLELQMKGINLRIQKFREVETKIMWAKTASEREYENLSSQGMTQMQFVDVVQNETGLPS
eukprot:Selendium_serpulae@DN5943_c0_g1_i3.p2